MNKNLLVPRRGSYSIIQDEDIVTRAEAILQGLVLYWNGKKCERGHESPRYTKTGHCKKCYQEFRAEEIDQKFISKDPLPKRKKGGD